MLVIVPLGAPVRDLRPYRALAFTSANGVRAFAGKSTERNLPAYAVGERTAVALRAAGFTPVIVPLSEFMRAGGGAKCLTLKLKESWGLVD